MIFLTELELLNILIDSISILDVRARVLQAKGFSYLPCRRAATLGRRLTEDGLIKSMSGSRADSISTLETRISI